MQFLLHHKISGHCATKVLAKGAVNLSPLMQLLLSSLLISLVYILYITVIIILQKMKIMMKKNYMI